MAIEDLTFPPVWPVNAPTVVPLDEIKAKLVGPHLRARQQRD